MLAVLPEHAPRRLGQTATLNAGAVGRVVTNPNMLEWHATHVYLDNPLRLYKAIHMHERGLRRSGFRIIQGHIHLKISRYSSQGHEASSAAWLLLTIGKLLGKAFFSNVTPPPALEKIEECRYMYSATTSI